MKHKPLIRRVQGLADDPLWYKDAVIYELRVRSFMDGNGDGVGDFPGLTSKLDYLEDLGVTALWLLPFYPSPGKDDGYDIADYTDVHPELGTLDAFRRFLDEAHQRGLRVITELVLNHTSDQHPWFQRARRAPEGSPERDFYVWSDTPDRYRDARIIFQDFEPSNWSWDPVAKAYYWHRFYAHQPDLNFDNPAVHDAFFAVVDFWLAMGVDGLRLDAVPYLYEREGTNCENLPETHDFLKKLRAHVDAKFTNRMLLAEANQWPEDAAAYFGEGDECHMNFHFPIMPRLYMSIHMEDRFPIIDILEQTPELEESCQWAVFLRNHDELTLEMVTEDERDYMWRAYAHEPAMRINLGIRRRLAPLVGNNRRVIELMNALLCSMPGTPVLYYGDEIGMGDNVYLGDRNGVRTPMQWSADRNAGFSRANPQRLILPVIIDPEYHYESVNVEAQQNNTNSLLWWTKRLLALRKRFQAFGRGSIRFLSPENPRVLAFIREYEGERILVVANLARHVQYVELDMADYEGMTPLELFGRNRFPRIGELPYLLTLSGYAFYWFSLEWTETAEDEERVAQYEPPIIEIRQPIEHVLAPESRPLLEQALPDFIASRRWYTGRDREITGVSIVDQAQLPRVDGEVHLLFVRVDHTTGEPETYVLPVALAGAEAAGPIRLHASHAILAEVAYQNNGDFGQGVLYDLVADPLASGPLLGLMAREALVPSERGEVRGARLEEIPTSRELGEHRGVRRDHVHAAVVYGEQLILKFFRRIAEGPSPEVEIGRFLHAPGHEARQRAPVPALVGTIEYQTERGKPAPTLATLHAYIPHEEDARTHALGDVARFFERVLTRSVEEEEVPTPSGTVVDRAHTHPPAAIMNLVGGYLDTAALLGRRTADLHLALRDPDEPDFAPEPFGALYQRSVYQTLRNLAGTQLRALRTRAPHLDEPLAGYARAVLNQRSRLYDRFAPLLDLRFDAHRGRHHGDLRLEKLLYTGKDFVIVDFAGDRSRPLSERRRKHSPLRDVASMLRSFENTVYSALLDPAVVRETDRETAESWADLWLSWVGSAYLGGYLEGMTGDTVYVPARPRELSLLLEVLLFERALNELGQALASDGDRLQLALVGLLRLLE